MTRLLLIALAGALLSACVSTAPVEAPEPAAQPVAASPEPAPEPPPPERAFPDDSIYPLLVAEFALRRRQYDVALENYMEQSRVLRDPGVSAHTTHLTQYLRRESEALEASQLWVALEPGSAEARSTYAALLVRQGRTLEALPHLAEVQRLGGQARFPALLTGFDELDQQQQADLVNGINELAGEWPDNTQLLLTQALILAEFEDFDQSLAKLDRIFEIEPQQQQALLLEARVRMARKDPKPFTRIEQTLENDPDNQQLRLQYARLLTAGDMKAARRQFEILSAQSPRDGDLLLSLALINREVGDDPAARAYLKQLLGLGQRVDEANYYLGRIAEDQGDNQLAISHYMQVEGEPEFISAANRIGQILIGSGQVEQARDTFRLQRQAHPGHAESLYGMEAELLNQAGQRERAMAVYREALQAFPESNTLRYNRSMLAEQMGDLALMERDLRNIIAREPDNATALNALGYTLANRTDRYSEAYDLITRALALQPEEPAILDSMGWVLYRKGRYEEALEYLTRAYTEFPDPEVAAHLGEVLWVSGKTEAATTVWQGALMKDPQHKVLRETLERLGVEALQSGTQAPSSAPAR
jgi:tetratricopeptide (TPR) repeat protein